MIDRLLAEAAQRPGAPALDGVQVLAPAGLLRRAFDPSWPVLLLPAGASPVTGSPSTTGGDVAPVRAAPDDATGRPGESGLAAVEGEPDAGAAAGAATEEPPAFDPRLLPGRAARPGDPAAVLTSLYPAGHPVLGLAGMPDTIVGELSGAVLEAGPHLLPGVEPLENLASPYGLPWIVARLRAPGGCPWDRAQTHVSLRPYLLEEAYEVYDALEDGATPALAGELGDLLLQVVLHAEHAAEAGVFDLSDVYRSIGAKIVRRHPHVFGDVHAASVDQVLRNWEALKAVERAEAAAGDLPEAGHAGDVATPATDRTAEAGAPGAPGRPIAAAFRGLARSLPALAYSQEMQGRAAALGYDWPDVEGVIDKLEEEAVELLEAESDAHRHEEYGDLLLVLVNLARKLGIDAEAALRDANRKFARRFAFVERYAAEQGRTLDRMTFEELDGLWDAAKVEEREMGAATPSPQRESS